MFQLWHDLTYLFESETELKHVIQTFQKYLNYDLIWIKCFNYDMIWHICLNQKLTQFD